MNKKYEYKTTTNCIGDNPLPPEGDGWKMCGSVVNVSYFYWFWEREVQPVIEEDKPALEDCKNEKLKFIVFTSDSGQAIVCTSETEKATLGDYFLNAEGTAPDGFDRKEVNDWYVNIQPAYSKSHVT